MKQLFFTICLAAFIVAACSSKKTLPLPGYSTEITFYESTATYYPGQKIMKCKLSDTATINGYKCISWIWFFENGQVRQFKTARDIRMDGFVIPSNSTIFFHEQSPDKIKYVWLAKDVTINNIDCKGGGKISIEFYENNSLKACFLTKDQDIQGYSCKSSLFDPVYFYDNGKIKILTLAADTRLNNTDFKKGESILIDENGAVTRFKR